MSEITLSKTLDRVKMGFLTEEGLKQAAAYVQAAAKLNAPAITGNLRQRIYVNLTEENGEEVADIYPNVKYARFVELGTGPRGQQNHEGISPNVSPTYSTSPWYIHESMVEPEVAKMYHWQVFETPNGKFYRCYGQRAHPFLYPALADNRQEVLNILKRGYDGAIRKGKR